MSPHRAQQDVVGGPLSGVQVARSNETVNFLLGNRRPAWMISQNEQASRSPHTNKRPTSRNRQGVHGVPIVPTQAPRKESSTNASNPPSVPGTVAPSAFRLRPHENLQDKSTAALESNQLITYFPYPISSSGIPQSFPSPKTPQPSLTFSFGSDCAAALPSPAPTDQPSPPTVTSNQTSHQIRETFLQSPELGLDFAANNSNATTAWTSETRAQETPANVLAQNFSGAGSGNAVPDLSKPTPLSTNLHSTSRFTSFEPSEHPALLTPSITLSGNPPSSVSVSLPLVPDSQAAPSPTLNISSRLSSGQNSRPPAISSPLVAGDHTPQPPGERQDAYSHAVQPAGTSRDSLDSFVQVVMAKNLDSYISDRGGMAKLPEDGTTAPRVRLLKDAIEKADYFYIVLHQILCLWTLEKKAAQELLGLPPDVTDGALGIMQNVLRKNENMGHDTIFFFANFPASSASGLWHTEAYRNHTRDISRFLNNLHEQWNRILVPAMRPHSGRGYPILADELRYQLKLRSPILETIFFTVTRRHTGVPDGLIADQMNALFRQDSQNDQTQMSEEEQRVFQHSLISRYKILVSQSQQQQQQQQRRVAHQQQQQHPQQQHHQQQSHQHQQAHLQQQQDFARAAAIAQQQTAIGNLRRMSTNFSPAQARAPTPIQNSPTQGAENMTGMPNSFDQRAGPVPSQLRLLSQSLANQPLTPTGSPHYPSMQLPHVAQAPGQISPVLQAPPGGLSMSMPGLTSPTQAVAPRAPPLHPPGLFRDPSHYQTQPHNLGYQLLQQARDAEQRHTRSRQLDTAQNQAQAMTQLQATNVVPPRIQLHHHHQHHHSSPRPQGMQQGPSRGAAVRTSVMQQLPSPQPVASVSHASPRGLGITQGAPSTQMTRPPSASSRPTRDAAGRLVGNLFRPPNVSIPLDRIPHTPWEPKAVGIALHQVQLRSPRRVPRELPRSEDQSQPVRFYQSTKELALGPIATPATNCVHRLAFVVPDEHCNKLCPTSNLVGDCVPVSEYFEGSLRYRLRLCELPINPAEPANISESVWAVAQSYWPEHIAIMVNENVVAVRRKQHNGQHLPVELTPYIQAGTNSITVSISPMPAAQKPNMMYFMAVEVVETLSHDNIVNMVLSQGTISADTTKQVIRSRLEPASSNGDDELVVVGSDLSIDLADPFSATIFKIPARGVGCTHMECFDLINWLQTRPVKPRCTAHGAGDACRVCNRGTEARPEPSLVDKWKCPLCDGDARPYSLRVDKFMEDVRKSLEAEGKLHTKTIYVRADGMWKAKEEEADDEEEEENAENGQPPAKRAKTRPSIPEPEIIELD
ncbi:hypothetical protein CaCOL14_005355 [Colletotrichum acutatum]